jgi:cell division protein FtsA
MDSKQIAAIDFGTAWTRVLLAEESENGINVLGFGKAPSMDSVRRGSVTNIQKAQDALMKAIADVEDQTQVKIDEAMVSIDGRLNACKTVKVENTRRNESELITEAEIESLISNVTQQDVTEGSVILNVIPQKYDVDDMCGYKRKDIAGMSGKKIRGFYKVFYGSSSGNKNINEVLTRAGITPKYIILSPIASAWSALTPEERDLGVALLDIGAGTSDLLVIKDNIIRHAAVIPFGGNSIRDDIHTCTGVPASLSEIMKVKYGCCEENMVNNNKVLVVKGAPGREDKEISIKSLAHIIEARMTEIFEAAAYEIEQSGLQGKLPGGLVITGGTCYMDRIQELANSIMGYGVRLGSPETLYVHTNKYEDIYSANSSVVTGLALYYFDNRKGIEEGKNIKKTIVEVPEKTEQKAPTDLFGNPEDGTEPVRKPIQDKKDKQAKMGQKQPKESLKDFWGTFFTSDDNNV